MARPLPRGRRGTGDLVSRPRGRAVVVEAHQLDHVANVGLVLDPPCGRPHLAGKDRVIDDPPLVAQLGPHVLGEGEVRGMVAVQMTDLPAAKPERELATPSGARLDPRPGRDLVGDLLACGLSLGHVASSRWSWSSESRSSSALEVKAQA